MIAASFDPLPAVTDVHAAMEDGALQAVNVAVCDALGIGHVGMPVTPQEIFDISQNKRVCREAK